MIYSTFFKTITKFFIPIFIILIISTQAIYATSDCTRFTIVEMQKALNNGRVTSEQCVGQFLARINSLSPINTPHIVSYTGDNAAAYTDLNTTFLGLNAFTSLNANALVQAHKADVSRAQGINKPLLGIPISIKDNIAVADYGLTNSSGIFSQLGYQPVTNNHIVQSLIDAGAIIIGQNNMHEFAFGTSGINFAFGPVRNAYNFSYISTC